MADVLTKSQRSYCMSRIKGKNTQPEIKLRRALWKAGLRYRLRGKLPGRPDLFFSKKMVAVFVDGCFWHGCPNHNQRPITNQEFWENKIHRNIERDERTASLLEASGWTVLRFWEHQVKRNTDYCVEIILEKLRK